MERVYHTGTKPGGLTFRVRYNPIGEKDDVRTLIVRDCESIDEAKSVFNDIIGAIRNDIDESSIVVTLLWRDNYKPLVGINDDVLRARINELEEPPKWTKFIVTLSWLVTAYNVDVDYYYGDWSPVDDIADDYEFKDLGVLSNIRAFDFNGKIRIPYTDNWREVLYAKVVEALNIDVPGQNA